MKRLYLFLFAISIAVLSFGQELTIPGFCENDGPPVLLKSASIVEPGSFITTAIVSTDVKVGVVPQSNTNVGNCIPFGNNDGYGFTGFIYRDVPAFEVVPGDTICFDLGYLNNVPTNRNISFSATNINPAPFTGSSQGVTATAWTLMVPETQTPINPYGNTVKGDYELKYISTSSFSFPGGGFVIGFGGTPPGTYVDNGCEQVLVGTSYYDVSGQFYCRFYYHYNDDQSLQILDSYDTGGFDGYSLGGFIIKSGRCLNNIVVDNDPGECGAVVTYNEPFSWGGALDISQIDGTGYTSGDLFPVGTTEQSYRLDFGGGEVDTCTFAVTVNDVEAPVVSCLADTTLVLEQGETTVVFNYGSAILSGEVAAEGITLANAPTNQGGVAYNPDMNLYYAVRAGSSGYIIYTYDENGNQLAANTAGFDFRGLWWNPNTSTLEGSSYAGNGYRAVDLDANGYALSTGTNDPATNYQPNSQSQGDYDFDVDEVIFYNDVTKAIDRTSRSTGLLLGSNSLTGLPATTLNYTFVGYTGINGAEILLYDYSNKKVYFIDKASGEFADEVQLPSTAPERSYLNTSYTNGYIWISDGSVWHSYKVAEGTGSGLSIVDNCDSLLIEQTEGLPSGSAFPIGTTTNTFKVTDGAGNEASCSFNVTVIGDDTPPVVTCRSLIVNLDRSGEYMLTEEDMAFIIQGTSDDQTADENLIITVTPNIFTCDSVGEVAVHVTVEDEGGNIGECETVVIVNDRFDISPFPTEDIIVELSEGVCETKVEYPFIGSFTPCVTFTQLEGLGPAGVFPVGTTTEVYEFISITGDTLIVSFTVTVIADPSEPTIDDIEDVTTDEDVQVVVNLTGIGNGGGCDTDDVTLSVSAFDQALILDPVVTYVGGEESGTLALISKPDQFGSTEITVQVTDGEGLVTAKTFMLTINPVNDVPLAVDDSYSYSEGSSNEETTSVLDNDTDVDNDVLTAILLTDPANGTLTLNSDGTFTYIHDGSETSSDAFTYKVNDGTVDGNTATVSITIVSANDAPVVVVPLADVSVKATDTIEVSISKEMGILFDDPDDLSLTIALSFESGTTPAWVSIMEEADVYKLIATPLEADTGCYNVIATATDAAGAMAADTFQLCVTKIPLGINDVVQSVFEFNMYPNPARNMVNIDLVKDYGDVEVMVMNIAGSEVFRKIYRSNEAIRFEMSDQVSGIYLVRVKSGEKLAFKKLILNKN